MRRIRNRAHLTGTDDDALKQIEVRAHRMSNGCFYWVSVRNADDDAAWVCFTQIVKSRDHSTLHLGETLAIRKPKSAWRALNC